MKGIILAGGNGTRLYPVTKVTSKQLLPVYDKPMIFYPLQTLIDAGIEEILIITAPERAGDFLNLLGSGSQFGVRLTYEVQDRPEGLPQAFVLAENFIGSDSVVLILGDNIYEDSFKEHVQNFTSGCHIFAKQVPDPERFGVVVLDDNKKPVTIQEKPKTFVSDLAITGFYMYDNRIVEIAKGLTPSSRNETEITDTHNWYLKKGELAVSVITQEWIDAGTFDSLVKANVWAMNKAKKK
jgi:glucose-1-phosphate thymidylyltransferase